MSTGGDATANRKALIKDAIVRGDVAGLVAIRDGIMSDPVASASDMVAVAKRLLGLDRVESARTAYEWLRSAFPADASGLVGLARVAAKEECWLEALELLTELFERFPDESSPTLLATFGRAQLFCGRLDEADAVFAELRGRYPELDHGVLGALRLAERRRDADAVLYWTGRLRERESAPATSAAMVLEEATRLDRDARGRDALMLVRQNNTARSDLKLTLKEVQLRRRYIVRASEFAMLESLAGTLQRSWPERIGAQSAAASAYLAADRPDLAKALVKRSYDRLVRHPAGCRIAAWYEAQFGSMARACSLWQGLLDNGYTPSVDAPCPQLKPIRRFREIRGSTALVTVVRDEMLLLPAFLDHHRAIGVHQFHVVDNGSTDGTRDFLLAQPDVDLWEAADGFYAAGGGMRWVNAMLDRAVTHEWSLYLDADELLVLPDIDEGLDGFTERLAAAGFDAAASFMLDMHPARWSDLDTMAADAHPIDLCPFFAPDYLFVGDDCCPWFEAVGGIRLKRFQTLERLRKLPLLRSGTGARYLDSHSTTPVRSADRACGILHFKLLKEALLARANTGGERLDQRGPITRSRHVRFAEKLRQLRHQPQDGERFQGWETLVSFDLVRELPAAA